MTVTSREQAWEAANKIYPTDYFKNYSASDAAGYDIYNSTVTGEMSWIADLGCRLELNIFVNGGGVETINIWIEEETKDVAAERALNIDAAYLEMDEEHREAFLDLCKLTFSEDDYKVIVIHLKSLECIAKTPKAEKLKKVICEQIYKDLRA